MAEILYRTFVETVNRYPDKTALMYKKEGWYHKITYRELRDTVTAVASNLKKLGINTGDTVGIFSWNRPEWVMADMAILQLGGIVVPVYPTLPSRSVKYMLKDSRIKMIFVENADLFSLIDGLRYDVPSLEYIVCFDDSDIGRERGFLRFEDLKRAKDSVPVAEPAVSSDTIATVVYTSGTTGEPKGVMLSHGNIMSNALTVKNRFHIHRRDVILSYLPLSHMFERTCGYYAMLFAGATIAYAENRLTLFRDIAEIRPTFILVVPGVIERAYEEAIKKIERGSAIRRKLVSSAIAHLNTYFNLRYKNLRVSWWLQMKCIFYNRLIASGFRKVAGGRLKVIASGGAPLDQKIAKVFCVLGLKVVEGYGLTETSPIVCCHSLDDCRLGTVGKPLPGIRVKIAENDEILVQGPNVMKGYLNKPTETEKVIDQQGWFHTGDQGKVDEDGNLIITGRIKELIVTSYGKKIAPAPIEAMMTKSSYISQAMLCGNERKYLVGVIVPDRDRMVHHAKERMIPFDSYQALLGRDEIKELVKHEIKRATRHLPSYEQMKSFILIPEPFSVENGMMTPTLKLRREQVIKQYTPLIESMYKRPRA